jgi:hypothetical protein
LAEHRDIITQKIKDVQVDFVSRGGATLGFVEGSMHRTQGYDVLVVMAGGNELHKAEPGYYYAAHDRIMDSAKRLGIRSVIFPAIWPRSDRVFNERARRLSLLMEQRYWRDPYAVHWIWDRRQSMRNYDRVHLENKGYKKAMNYFISMILWTIKHKLH